MSDDEKKRRAAVAAPCTVGENEEWERRRQGRRRPGGYLFASTPRSAFFGMGTWTGRFVVQGGVGKEAEDVARGFTRKVRESV